MRVYKSSTLELCPREFVERARDIFLGLKSHLAVKYKVDPDDVDYHYSVRNQLSQILYLTRGNLQGKAILDLGCGSTNTSDGLSKKYYPWLCRVLHELGVNVIGVDVADLSDEEFENYSVDLLQENSLKMLRDNSVDVAHADNLLTSPRLDGLNSYNLERSLLTQLPRIVKPKGIFIREE